MEFDPIHELVLRIEDAITKIRSEAIYSGHDVIDLLLDLRASAMLESTLAELCRDPSAASAAKVLELEPSAT